MKVKKIYGNGREQIVDSLINRRQLVNLNRGSCTGVRCNDHKCPHNLGIGEPCNKAGFYGAGGRLEEAPEEMIQPKVGEDIGLVAVDRVQVLLFATVGKDELEEFSKYKNIVSANVDVGSGKITVFYWG